MIGFLLVIGPLDIYIFHISYLQTQDTAFLESPAYYTNKENYKKLQVCSDLVKGILVTFQAIYFFQISLILWNKSQGPKSITKNTADQNILVSFVSR